MLDHDTDSDRVAGIKDRALVLLFVQNSISLQT